MSEPGTDTVVELKHVSRWYGPVLGLRDVSLRIGRGVTGLLGPNGAGKSTLLKLLTGEIRASRGEVRVLGHAMPDAGVYKRLGYAPEFEVFFEELTAREFVAALAEASGYTKREALERSTATLTRVGLEKAMDRRLATYSKGMRQRAKLAQALVHEPDVVLLDEPMTGLDPMARAHMIELIHDLGSKGKSVLVSSHLLDEVETMTNEIIVLYQGQLLAQGNVHAIRELIDQHPHRIELVCDRPRELAGALAAQPFVAAIRFYAADAGGSEHRLEIETREPDACYAAIPRLATERGVKLQQLTSPDDNLAAVFRYLTTDRHGAPSVEVPPNRQEGAARS